MPKPPLVFSAIVANWEGREWIERALSSMQLALRAAGYAGEIIVVDDASEDNSPRRIAENFPRVRLARNPRNIGFGATVHRGARLARGRILVFLNNDLVVREDFFARILAPFQRDPFDRLFAVASHTLSWDGASDNHVCMAARFERGRVMPAWSAPESRARCLFAQGGAMACRRDMYFALGGFDPIFHPGYWEDYDLCWRAARAGLMLLYEPSAIAFHVGGGSMTRRYGEREVFYMRARNHLLFEWMNLTDPRLLARHTRALSRLVLREWVEGRGFGFSRIFARALKRLPAVMRGRIARARRTRRLMDRYGSQDSNGGGGEGEAALAAAAARRTPLSDAEILAIGKGFELSESP